MWCVVCDEDEDIYCKKKKKTIKLDIIIIIVVLLIRSRIFKLGKRQIIITGTFFHSNFQV